MSPKHVLVVDDEKRIREVVEYALAKAGFRVTGKINRNDWNLNWNTALESGGVLVGDEVKIMAEMQFVHQTKS